jgi:MEMO1 family protein
MQSVRRAAVAGSFYPSNAARLSKEVDELIFKAKASRASGPLKAAIVPHAGYIYSGAVGASAYALLRAARERVTRVVLLGPSHFVRLEGLGLPGVEAMGTPLGEVAVDLDGVKRALRLPQVSERPQAHAHEHSLEVQIPFLQRVLGQFTVVPLVVGDADPDAVAEVIELLWGGEETIILVSSDLSHYLPYELAVKADRRTAARVLELDPVLLPNEDACGATPINGLLVACAKAKLRPAVLDLRNSGDTAGPRSEVVGYGSFAFYQVRDG